MSMHNIFRDMFLTADLKYCQFETVFIIHDKYVVARADKAANNIVLIYKKHYIDCLIK
jgi:hypothetical protein